MTDDPHTTETATGQDTTAVPADASNPATAPASAPALASPASPIAPPAERKMSDDIAKILKEIKLPEPPVPLQKRASGPQAPALGAPPTFVPGTGPGQKPQQQRMAPIIRPPVQQAGDAAEESAATPVESLHTMKTDLQRTVRDRKISAVRAAAMEQDRGEQPRAEALQVPPKKGVGKAIFLVVATLTLIVLGAVALYVAYVLTQGAQTPQTATIPGSLIFSERRLTFPLADQSPAALKQALGGLLQQQGSVGTITRIVPTLSATDTAQGQRPATLSEFFQATGIEPPADLTRALSDNFFFGIHTANTAAPIFIIPVLSYDRAFADMLLWEQTMDSDLSPLFKDVPAFVASKTGGVPVERQFQDLVMQNYDVRALEDDSGNVVLYYSFPTPSLLVIAASPYTFPEVLSRLQAERKL